MRVQAQVHILRMLICVFVRQGSLKSHLPPKHLGDTAGVVHEVVLPTFKDAVAQAQLAAADVDVVIFSRGCNGTQTMRRTMRAKSGGEECA